MLETLIIIFIFTLCTLILAANKLRRISTHLNVAEGHLRQLDSLALDNQRRMERVFERRNWSQMESAPFAQVNIGSHSSLAQILASQNERELQDMRAANENVRITASLLLLIYQTEVRAAQSVIKARYAETGAASYRTGDR